MKLRYFSQCCLESDDNVVVARSNHLHEKKESNDEKIHKKYQKKTSTETIGNLLVNDVEDGCLNKVENLNVKVRRYLAAFSVDIIDNRV